MLDRLNSDSFASHVDETFRISADGLDPFEAILVQVDETAADATPQDQDAQRNAFSIVLRGPKEVVLPQRIYTVEHEAMGSFELFLVTIGPDKEGMQYEAVFT